MVNIPILYHKKLPRNWPDDYEIISQITMPSHVPVEMPVNSDATIDGLEPNPHLFAVLIDGSHQQRFWYDISAVYNTLIDVYGYTKENIFVHIDDGSPYLGCDLDGDEIPDDVDYTAYKLRVRETFDNLSGEEDTDPLVPELGPDDQLFIFVDCHGGSWEGATYVELFDGDYTDEEMAIDLEGINCSQMIIMLQPCHSGGFIEELSDFTNVQCKNRVIHTASDYLETSWADYHLTWPGINWFLFYANEFTLYWNAAARGYFPVYNAPWLNSWAVDDQEWVNSVTTWYNHPDAYHPDTNGDGFVQMEEAFEWADNFDTWSGQNDPNNYYEPYCGSPSTENPQSWPPSGLINGFEEDLYTLSGLAGHIENSQIVESRNYLIGGEFNIESGVNLTLEAGTGIYLGNETSQIIVDEDAGLVLEDNTLVFGTHYSNKIIVNGDLEVGENVTFTSEGPKWDLNLNNYSLQTIFNNTTFEKCELHNYGESLTITNSTFDDCYIVVSHRGNVTVTDNTSFNRTWLWLENIENNNKTATITHCSFTTDYTMAAIDIWNYYNYSIMNNTIDGYYNGIQIIQSGYGQSRNNMISYNTISNCTRRGIMAYGTLGNVSRNHITNNMFGVWFANNSIMGLYGDYGGGETQEIMDNESYEVFASENSFPIYFRYNVIIDDDNLGGLQGDPLVYHSTVGGMLKDVRYNCWGDANYQDLYPLDEYIWNPHWCPENGGGITTGSDEDMYELANSLFDTENYTGAKSMYEMLIDQYPESKFAKAAMQKLFALEQFVSNDYLNLKQYYETNPTIQSDPELAETGDYMVSKCYIKLENWPDAISYYEDIILQPDNLEDSIFAIIDLGYVYFVMENSGYKSAYTGSLAEYKPSSNEQFIEDRDYLLSLIPGDQMSETMKGNIAGLKEGELLQNVPNPFKGSTQIWYKLENESNIQITIYNYTGQLIRSIDDGRKAIGSHYIEFDAIGLKNGIYFYSISINGQTTDSKKMTIMK